MYTDISLAELLSHCMQSLMCMGPSNLKTMPRFCYSFWLLPFGSFKCENMRRFSYSSAVPPCARARGPALPPGGPTAGAWRHPGSFVYVGGPIARAWRHPGSFVFVGGLIAGAWRHPGSFVACSWKELHQKGAQHRKPLGGRAGQRKGTSVGRQSTPAGFWSGFATAVLGRRDRL